MAVLIDATQPTAPRHVATILPMTNAGAVAARDDFAYLLTAAEGLRVVDLSQRDHLRQRGHAATLQGVVGAVETGAGSHVLRGAFGV
jgi:hypothetical protein